MIRDVFVQYTYILVEVHMNKTDLRRVCTIYIHTSIYKSI